MEDDSIFEKWKTTLNFWILEDNLIFRKRKTTSIFWHMEDDLNILENGRRPKFFHKWKTTSIFWQMEDDLSVFSNGRHLILFWKMKDDLKYLENDLENGRHLKSLVNGRWPKYLRKWRTTSIFLQVEDHINFFLNGIWLEFPSGYS